MKDSYFGVRAISNTSLSYLNPEEKGCPEKFFDFLEGRIEEKESKAMLTGTLVHTAIFEPDKLQVMTMPKISDSIKNIVEIVYQTVKEDEFNLTEELTNYEEEITAAAFEVKYGQNWKQDTLIKKVITEGGEEYFKMLVLNTGKILVPADVYANLAKIEAALKMNPAASEILFEAQDGKEIYNEKEIFFKAKELDCKAKIDRLIIDHENKTFKIVDLKTTSESVEFFPKLFYDRHVYRQLAMYEIAATKMLNQEDKSYSPETHSLIVCETTGYHRVRRFDISRNFINKGLIELKSLLERVKWHLENNEKIHSMEDILSNFSFLIED